MDEIREELASYAHEAWSGWMTYLFQLGTFHDGEFTIHREQMERWTRQSNTPYNQLPEHEKESDREEADKMIAIFKRSN